MTQTKLLKYGEAMHTALKEILKEHGSSPASPAIQAARRLVSKMHVRDATKQPVRAFFVEVYGCPKTYIPARCSEEAKWAVIKQAPKADRKDLLSLVKIGRAKEYDVWAPSAERRLHVADEVLEAVCRSASIRIANISSHKPSGDKTKECLSA